MYCYLAGSQPRDQPGHLSGSRQEPREAAWILLSPGLKVIGMSRLPVGEGDHGIMSPPPELPQKVV